MYGRENYVFVSTYVYYVSRANFEIPNILNTYLQFRHPLQHRSSTLNTSSSIGM